MDTVSRRDLKGSAPHSRLVSVSLDGHVHRVHFHESDPFLIDSFSGLIADGLARGESAVVIMTQPHCADIEARISLRGLDIEAARVQGRFLALDAATALSAFMVEGWPDEGKFASVIGGAIQQAGDTSPRRKVRAFGEMVDLLAVEGQGEAALQVEQLWNKLAGKLPY